MKVERVILILAIFSSLTILVTPTPVSNGAIKEITKNVYVFTGVQGFQLNSMFIVTSKGVIAIEPFNSVHSRKLIKAIRTITQKPIKYLLISHNHWDHASGGKVFNDEGATVIAHQEAADWMEENPTDDLYLPDRTWRGRKQTLCLGEARVDLNYFGINHGMGMTVFVYKPPKGTSNDNIAYIADLVTPNRVFFSTIPDSNMKESIRTYSEIVKLPFNRVVFSHGPLPDSPPDGTLQDVRNTFQYAVDLDAGVKKGFAEGKNLVLNPELLELQQYKNLGGYELYFAKNVEKFAFELFLGPYPWRSVKRYMRPSKRAFPPRRNKRRYNQH